MASGNRSGYGSWELDKGEVNFDFCDVGLGLKLPWHHHHHQQQQQQRQNSISWLQNRQNQSENSRSPSPSPTISGFSRGLAFTAGQRQELERQTMIFKYMMASIPVPAELLMPFPKYPSSSSSPITPHSSSEGGKKTGVEMRYGGNRGGDAEPWRCRRTDGKKWRCSRDVAPDQKYCERHSHKGRPSRSRKPVESPSPSSSSSLLSSSSSSLSLSSPSSCLLSSSVVTTTTTTTPCVSTCNNPIIFTPFSIPKPSSSSFDLPSPQFNPLPRYPDWFMKKEVAPTPSSCLFSQHVGGNDTTTRSVDDHQSCLLPRPFIDAWSLGDHVHDPKDGNTSTNSNNNATLDNEHNGVTTNNKCHAPPSPLNSILPLTLSMSAGFDSDHGRATSLEHGKDDPEIRLSALSHHHHHHQPLNWMSSWISSPPGGPLAEALCLGISGAGNGEHGHNNTSSSTTTTLG